MAHIYPQPEEFADVFNELLALTGDPRAIATTTEGPVPLGLVVSDDVYQRWQESTDSDDEPSDQDKPKKRGRPRKVAAPEQEPTT
jgi:hypothetical protein